MNEALPNARHLSFNLRTVFALVAIVAFAALWGVERQRNARIARKLNAAQVDLGVCQSVLLQQLYGKQGRPISDFPMIDATAERMLTEGNQGFDLVFETYFRDGNNAPPSEYVIYCFDFHNSAIEGETTGFFLLARKGLIVEFDVVQPIW